MFSKASNLPVERFFMGKHIRARGGSFFHASTGEVGEEARELADIIESLGA